MGERRIPNPLVSTPSVGQLLGTVSRRAHSAAGRFVGGLRAGAAVAPSVPAPAGASRRGAAARLIAVAAAVPSAVGAVAGGVDGGP